MKSKFEHKDNLLYSPKECLKKIFSYLLAAIVSLVFVSYLAAFFQWEGGLIPRSVLLLPYNVLQLQMPLWATILLCFLCGLYIYKRQSKQQMVLSSPTPYPKITYFDVGKQKWKTTIYENNFFEIDTAPLCVEHDLPFVDGPRDYHCPEVEQYNCENKIQKNDYGKFYDKAKSYIDKQIREKKC